MRSACILRLKLGDCVLRATDQVSAVRLGKHMHRSHGESARRRENLEVSAGVVACGLGQTVQMNGATCSGVGSLRLSAFWATPSKHDPLIPFGLLREASRQSGPCWLPLASCPLHPQPQRVSGVRSVHRARVTRRAFYGSCRRDGP